MIERLDDPARRLSAPQWYYSCPKCGWCSPLRTTRERAEIDGRDHEQAKADAEMGR